MAVRTRRDKSELQEILAALREEMPNLEKTYHVKGLGVFGPFARGTNRPGSTLNLLVDYRNLPTLFGLMELEDHLSDLLGVKVDLGPRESLKAYCKERILREEVPV